MPIITRLLPNLIQPQYPVRVATKPITKGLQFAWNAATPSLDLVSRGPIASVNGVLPAATKHGLSGNFNAASTQYYDCGTGPNVTFSGDMTVFVRYSLKSLPASLAAYQLFSRDNDTGGRSFTVDVYNSAAKGIRLYVNGGGTAGVNEVVEGRTPVVGDDRAAMLVWSPSTNVSEVWIDGVLVATTSATASPPSATTSARIGSRSYPGFQEHLDGGVTQIGAWGRRLSAAEIVEQFRQHWQIFEPRKQNIYVAAAASGGISAALTGQNVTVATGNLTASITAPLTGQAVPLGQGTVTASTGGVSAALTGQSVGVALGSFSAAITASLTGQSVPLSLGTMVPAFQRAITGQGVTVSQGSMVGAVAPALTGQNITVSVGSVALGGNITRALTGQSLTVGLGNITIPGAAVYEETSYAPPRQKKTRAPNFAPRPEPQQDKAKPATKPTKLEAKADKPNINRLRVVNDLIPPDSMFALMQKRKQQDIAQQEITRLFMYNIRARAALLAA